jgi:serine/threonine protein kinase
MNPTSNQADDAQQVRVGQIADEFTDRLRRGERPDVEEYVQRHPELAVELRGVLGLLLALGQPAHAGPVTPPLLRLRGYEVLEELGQGGMGVVYRAYDQRRREVVALKVMQRFEPAALYRFKQEFRALADQCHPNLVGLYDLVSEGDQWFFTMELVEGRNFLAYIRSAEPGAPEIPIDLADTYVPSAPGENDRPASLPGSFHSDRLRRVLKQLADGVMALHRAGKLHRDIKPANVLVTSGERVVLLDFGLAVDTGPAGLYQSTEQHILGTAAYMAPEQAAGAAVSPASDWYSVGVMLYEALTGRVPFAGPFMQVIVAKQMEEPPPPADLVPSVPDDLNSLCIDLLRRDPAARPTGQEMLRRLGGDFVASSRATAVASEPRQRAPLVGRERHLASLHAAFGDARQGRTVLMYVHGQSGMGKSALVERFLEDLTEHHSAVVLAGRCYEQESVPYKALDSLVDALSRYLRRLPNSQAQALLPRDIAALARVFPVLRQVAAVAQAPARGAETPDQQELRRRAFTALRELLARLGDRTPLVLFIDDLQWGDVDSAALLSELVRPPDPPVLLLVGSYRSEDVGRSKCLQALLQGQADPALDRRGLSVDALTLPEARELAAALSGGSMAAQADVIGRESRGSPFFVYELVQSVQSEGGKETSSPQTERVELDEVLWSRIRRLPEGAQRLLEVIAVAGRPLRQADARSVAEMGAEERSALALLHTARLIRSTGLTDQDEIETYHDRIRETVVARLAPPTLAQYHRQLATVLEASGDADAEVLAVHYQRAGEVQRAGQFFALAADQAAEALAFDRAVTLYRRALELMPADDLQGQRLRARLGDALANAGRGAEAAREYLAAARSSSTLEESELRRQAAIQLLISGHVDEGLGALRGALETIGVKLPRTPRGALLALLFHRTQLRLRGIRFKERDVGQIPTENLKRVDLLWSAATGLSMIDPIQGANIQTYHLLLALRLGEPHRIARALALEAGHLAALGGRGRRRALKLLDAADKLAQSQANPLAVGLVLMIRGWDAYLEEQWRTGQELAGQAEEVLRRHCVGVWHERDTAQIIRLVSLENAGDLAELSRVLPAMFQEARERGDLYAMATALGPYVRPLLRLAADKPEQARQELTEVLGKWSQRGFHLQHAIGIYREVEIDLYLGDSNRACRRAAELLSLLASSLLSRLRYLRIWFHHLRARTALAAAASGLDAKTHLKAAERQARVLERERTGCSAALAQLVRAGIAAACHQQPASLRLLTDALKRCEAIDAKLYAAAARRRLGQLTGGEEGRAIVARADDWMTGQTIKNPARMTAMLAPGFPDLVDG